MTRILLLPLVLALSGFPAVAVVCDVLLCADRAEPAAQATCHDHAAPRSGEEIAPRAADCTHLSAAEPYLGSASRLVSQLVGSTPFLQAVSAPALARLHSVDRILVHGPPRALHAAPSLALRI